MRSKERLYKNYDPEVDKGVFNKVMPFLTTEIDANIYDKTTLTSLDGLKKLLTGSPRFKLFCSIKMRNVAFKSMFGESRI